MVAISDCYPLDTMSTGVFRSIERLVGGLDEMISGDCGLVWWYPLCGATHDDAASGLR